MKLHYSQTCDPNDFGNGWFQYLMKLHYSQTLTNYISDLLMVSVPYEITLLSNTSVVGISNNWVSVPYEITLLSNYKSNQWDDFSVSVPYEITLLSNLK